MSHEQTGHRPVEQTTPVEVRAPREGEQMHIVWQDGHIGVYPYAILRGLCPCATCQGHQGPIRFVQGGSTVLQDIAEVGSYALRLGWDDGHTTGIYSFRYLRDLCTCSQCGPLQGRELRR
jgi:DUF971 family protein